MSKLLVGESFINATKGWRFGDSEPYEPYTDEVGKLFRDMQKEYGRCISPVCLDTPKGAQRCGWVFHKRMQYDDCKDTYIREVWVHVYEACEPEDPEAVVTRSRNGAVTRHPYKTKFLGAA